MEFRELTKEELDEWKRLYDDGFESYEDDSLDDEARELLCDIVCATAIYGDGDDLLAIRVYQGPTVQRWQSNPTVAKFLRRAYEHFVAQDHTGACCNLGAMYNSGEGVEQSYENARELYEMGADLGDDQASVNLGYIYYYGRCSEGINYTKAYECYARGAFLRGNPEAYWKLGDLYAGGYGVRQNDWIAWLMYSKAYEYGKGSIYAGRAAHHVADYLMIGIDDKLEKDPERALLLYTEAEVGYRKAIEDGLDYYAKCLKQAIEGQKKAREAIIELRRPRRWDEE